MFYRWNEDFDSGTLLFFSICVFDFSSFRLVSVRSSSHAAWSNMRVELFYFIFWPRASGISCQCCSHPATGPTAPRKSRIFTLILWNLRHDFNLFVIKLIRPDERVPTGAIICARARGRGSPWNQHSSNWSTVFAARRFIRVPILFAYH